MHLAVVNCFGYCIVKLLQHPIQFHLIRRRCLFDNVVLFAAAAADDDDDDKKSTSFNFIAMLENES